jgi:hypothetical protein
MSSWRGTFHFFESFPFFGVLTPTGEKIVISIIFHFILVCNGQMSCTCCGRSMDKNFLLWLVKLL